MTDADKKIVIDTLKLLEGLKKKLHEILNRVEIK